MGLYRDKTMQGILLYSLLLLLAHLSHLPRTARVLRLPLRGLAPWAALSGLLPIHWTVMTQNHYVAWIPRKRESILDFKVCAYIKLIKAFCGNLNEMPQMSMQTSPSVCCAVSRSGLNFLLSQKGKKKWADNQSNLALAQTQSLSDVKITNRKKMPLWVFSLPVYPWK